MNLKEPPIFLCKTDDLISIDTRRSSHLFAVNAAVYLITQGGTDLELSILVRLRRC